MDAAVSARKKAAKRPELLRLLDDVKAGKIDMVVFTKLDRWFRNIAEYYKVQDILEANHVGWKTIHEDYDTTTASGRLKINIMLSVAQDEADRTGERIKAVFASKRDRLEPVTGHVPTGYIIQGKKIVKDPSTEQAVEEFFSHYLKNGSVSAAIEQAAQFGLHMKYQLASKMLSKTAYYGCFSGVEGMCPPYITKEQFEYIDRSRRRPVRKTKVDRIYLFSSLLTCAECGARMGGRAHKYKQVENMEYNCPGHYLRKGCENRTNIRERDIEQYLLDHMDSALENAEARYSEASREKNRDFSSEISAVKRKMSRLKDLYVNDLIDLQGYRADYEPLKSKLDKLEVEKSIRMPDLSRIRNTVKAGWKETYHDLERVEKRAFWRSIIHEIRIYSDRHIEFDIVEF